MRLALAGMVWLAGAVAFAAAPAEPSGQWRSDPTRSDGNNFVVEFFKDGTALFSEMNGEQVKGSIAATVKSADKPNTFYLCLEIDSKDTICFHIKSDTVALIDGVMITGVVRMVRTKSSE